MTPHSLLAALIAAALASAGTASAQTQTDDGKDADVVGFMAPVALGVTSALELTGATICVTAGTPAEASVADFFTANAMEYLALPSETPEQSFAAYDLAACDILAADTVSLEIFRQHLVTPADHVLLPETLTRQADPK